MYPEYLLKEIGFSEYQIKCFLSLCSLKAASISEIAKHSKVPRNKVYENVQKLEENGFLMEISTKPKKFRVLSLDKIRENIREKKDALDTLEKNANIIIDQLNKISYTPMQDLLWIIKGQKNITQKIAFEINNSNKEILASTRSNIDYLTEFRNTKKAIERGSKVKIIGSLNKQNMPKIKRWLKIGVEFRVYNEKKFGPQGIRFGTFDDKSCRLTIGKPDVQKPEDYITIWSESPSMVSLLKRQFYFMWEQCKQPKF